MAWQQERLTLFAEVLGHVHAHERAANLRGQRYNLQHRSQSHARGKASSLQKQNPHEGHAAYIGGRSEVSLAALTARRADLGIILHSIAACRCLKQVLLIQVLSAAFAGA